jgi:fatty acid desaturase
MQRVATTTEAREHTEQLQQFGKAIDEIRRRAETSIGAEDVAHIRRVRRASTTLELIGRALIHVSPEPLSFVAGVVALFLHKQLETAEIGHTVLHGAYDGLPGAEAFASTTFRWRTAIDEESWRVAHNVRHHQYTNIGGRDPDIHFGPVRLTTLTPHNLFHYVQVPWLLWEASVFLFGINVHVTGVIDAVFGNGRPEKLDFLRERSSVNVRRAFGRMLRKLIPHVAREYVFFPALAGPFFAKVLFGNWLSATMCNVYSAATIYCGHVGDQVRRVVPHAGREQPELRRTAAAVDPLRRARPANRAPPLSAPSYQPTSSDQPRRAAGLRAARRQILLRQLAANAGGSISPAVPPEPRKCTLTNRRQRETVRQPAHTPVRHENCYPIASEQAGAHAHR